MQDTNKITKALSIKNPYAYLIAKGIKDVENRTWKTNYRGKILIHTTQKPAPIFKAIPKRLHEEYKALMWDMRCTDLLKYGAIIGEVEIIDCVKEYESDWTLPNHWYWILDNSVLYDYWIPNVKGRLSLWNYNVENPPKVINDGHRTWCACDNPVLAHNGGDIGLATCRNCCENYYR